MPDLGVDWSNMEEQQQGADIAVTPDTSIADAATERNYAVRIEGVEGVAAEALLQQFHQLSALEEAGDERANAAQIDRRARQDADLLSELLRAHGYYDAFVRTRVEPGEAASSVLVTLEAEPGPLYRFAEVTLPGLDAAGEDAAALREAFGVAANDPVDAAQVTAGEAALRVELGKR